MRHATAAFFAASLTIAPLAALADSDITVPDGFSVAVAHDGVGRARHIAVRDNGDLFVALTSGEIVALRDSDGDGSLETVERRTAPVHTGLKIHNDYLYVSNDTEVNRVTLDDALMPQGDFELIVGGMPAQSSHTAAPLAFDTAGHLYVGSGAPSNACQDPQRVPGAAGQDPCPQLAEYGGIWRFDADTPGQTFTEDARYITGMRQAVGLDWSPSADKLAFVMHGRDQLHSLWPDRFTVEDNAQNPAEEFHVLSEGDNLGWPYSYWSPVKDARMVAPEYGGNADSRSDNDAYKAPDYAFPAHWAPNDILFYEGDMFPASYKNGAFIAFHGSWNRAPEPQAGYRVMFLPMKGATPGEAMTFANGFAGTGVIESPGDARFRPMGLATAPDGSLYIADSKEGRIWRISYDGA